MASCCQPRNRADAYTVALGKLAGFLTVGNPLPRFLLLVRSEFRLQACSAPMLSAIAEDTKAAVNLLPAGQRFLFFGTTTDQCDAQVEAYKAVGLNVEPYHNNMTAAAQDSIIARFRAGEIQGLCTVSKVNRGFDCPAVSLVVIGFGTASRAKFEQMCGRAQRVYKLFIILPLELQ